MVERRRGTFSQVEAFCLFLGHPGSEQGLVGALVDAHPNAVVPAGPRVFGEGDRAGDLAFASRKELYKALVRGSANQAKRKGRDASGATRGEAEARPAEPGDGWQGRFSELLVLGTRDAHATAEALRANPTALKEVRKQAGVPLKLINVVRSPWDDVGTLAGDVPVERMRSRAVTIARYLLGAQMIRRVREDDHDVLDVAFEDMTADPRGELRRLCDFLGLEAPDEFLAACSSLVETRPDEPLDHAWTAGEIEAIAAAIDEFPWLERYRSVKAPVAA